MEAIQTLPIPRVDPSVLTNMGEHFAAGFFEEPDAPAVVRMARAVRRHLERRDPPAWGGGELYPSGAYAIWSVGAAVSFSYSHSMVYNREVLDAKKEKTDDPETLSTLDALDAFMSGYFRVGGEIDPEFWLGGDGYTHSIPNFGRMLREGLSSYGERVAKGLEVAQAREDTEPIAFYSAMEDVLAGIAVYHQRALEALRKQLPTDPEAREIRRRLLTALRRVPFRPARTFYEAMVGLNVLYYLDGCDSLGRFDQDLAPFYERDLAAGRIVHEDAVRLIRQLWESVDANSGWNVAIGGSRSDGSPAYNRVTLACLQAARTIRRPNLALRVRRDTPDEIFDAALDAIATGCGIPALYNEEGYLQALRDTHLNVRQEDRVDFAFGGCTETMMHGTSNVGSLDAGINLPQILSRTLTRELERASTFETLFDAYRGDIREAVARLAEGVSRDQRMKARHQPQPVRSLFIDDCIDAGIEYNAGGARYNWSVINVGGLANVVDSLAAVREVVYERGETSGGTLKKALAANFEGHPDLRKRVERCPRFGNDEADTDELATELSTFVFEELRKYAPWRGGKFLPGCLMFVTYAGAGEKVPATPDGRLAGTPIADSAGPVQGRDRSGPTAMIRSVTRINHHLAPGTLVVNARFSKAFFSSEGRDNLKSLIRTYFQLGGMQIQINVVDQEVLKDALEHPEHHEDLIIRVGGYSEYFNRLSDALKLSILERTEH